MEHACARCCSYSAYAAGRAALLAIHASQTRAGGYHLDDGLGRVVVFLALLGDGLVLFILVALLLQFQVGGGARANYPLVLHGRGGLRALRHVGGEQAGHEGHGEAGGALPGLIVEGELAVDYPLVRPAEVVRAEGQCAAQHRVAHHPHSPDVDLAAVLLLADDLRRQVVVGAPEGHGPRAPGVLQGDGRHLGQPEVADLDVGVAVPAHQQDVLGLHVAMHDSLRMQESNGLEHLAHDHCRLGLLVVPSRADAVE
mmetsp:Transcript_49279/g.140752  ORF Transcript_49279/g.140752 Transcript_49279/m.140752 type:complete len:255 (+) Transcript_49279:234-998(+)